MMMTDVARLRQALDEAPFSPEERREVEQMVADGVGWDDFRHWLEVVQANRLASASKHQRELTAMERFREHHDFLWKRYPHLTAREVQSRVAWINALAPGDRQEVMRMLDEGRSWDDIRGRLS
jgi:hypothetical protein